MNTEHNSGQEGKEQQRQGESSSGTATPSSANSEATVLSSGGAPVAIPASAPSDAAALAMAVTAAASRAGARVVATNLSLLHPPALPNESPSSTEAALQTEIARLKCELKLARAFSSSAEVDAFVSGSPALSTRSMSRLSARTSAMPSTTASPWLSPERMEPIRRISAPQQQQQQQAVRAASPAAFVPSVPYTARPASPAASYAAVAPAIRSPRHRPAREQGFFRQLASTVRFYLVLLLCTLLELVSAVRGLSVSHALMELPHARDLAMLSSDVCVALGEAVLDSALFPWIPFAGFVRGVLRDEQLHTRWHALPEWPEVEERRWTEGPLRPAFALLATLPLLGAYVQIESEDPRAQARPTLQDGPLTAALKGHASAAAASGGAEPLANESLAAPARQRSSFMEFAAQAHLNSTPMTGLNAANVRSADSVSPLPRSASARWNDPELYARLDAQQSILAALQADRAEVRAQLRRLEELIRQSNNTSTSGAAAAPTAAPVADSKAPAQLDPSDLLLSPLSRRRGSSKVQSLVSAHEHSIAQSAEEAAAAAAAQANSAQLREQNEQMRRAHAQRLQQMRDLTDELVQARRETRTLRERLAALGDTQPLDEQPTDAEVDDAAVKAEQAAFSSSAAAEAGSAAAADEPSSAREEEKKRPAQQQQSQKQRKPANSSEHRAS